jgi:hypothetical protein
MTALIARKEGFRPLSVDDFLVPAFWHGEQVLLVPAHPEWVDLDYAAVIASRSKLKHIFGPQDDWPPEDLNPEMDESDLGWHAREFERLRSFAYHLLSHDRQRCLGCLYLYPSASQEHDAEAYLWTHISLAETQAALIETEVINWVNQEWPVKAVAWPGRFIPFSQWEKADIPNYYASTRMNEDSFAAGI